MVELKNEIHSLVDELNALSARNDDLIGERERDAQIMNEMEGKVQEYKRKHDSVRIELRNLKGELIWTIWSPAYIKRHPQCLSRNRSTMTIYPPRPMEISPTSTSPLSKPLLTACCKLLALRPLQVSCQQ